MNWRPPFYLIISLLALTGSPPAFGTPKNLCKQLFKTPAAAWAPENFMSPTTMKEDDYFFIAHGIDMFSDASKPNVLLDDLERVYDFPKLSASVIKSNFGKTFTGSNSEGGFIIRAPVSNILAVAPKDLGSGTVKFAEDNSHFTERFDRLKDVGVKISPYELLLKQSKSPIGSQSWNEVVLLPEVSGPNGASRIELTGLYFRRLEGLEDWQNHRLYQTLKAASERTGLPLIVLKREIDAHPIFWENYRKKNLLK